MPYCWRARAIVFCHAGIASALTSRAGSSCISWPSRRAALREGQLMQLDPALDVNALAIPAWQKTIARALQQYGMYLRDGSGSLAVYAENPVSRGYDAWSPLGLGGLDAASLAGIPWNRMRVLAAPDYPAC